MEAGAEVPSPLDDVVGEGGRPADDRRRVGAFGHDPHVRQPALVHDGVDLVEIRQLNRNELERGPARRLEGAEDVGLVAPVERIPRVRQLRRHVPLVDETVGHRRRDRARRLDLDAHAIALEGAEQFFQATLLLQHRLAAGDDDHVHVHGVDHSDHVLHRHLVQLGDLVEAVPRPRVRRVAERAGQIAPTEAHEPAAPARRRTLTLECGPEHLVDGDHNAGSSTPASANPLARRRQASHSPHGRSSPR